MGHPNPHHFQHLLSRAHIDEPGLVNDLRDYARTHLGEHDAVLILDKTGDLKKGTATVGVQRQYTGTAGCIENAQVAVYPAYATPAGHALIDHHLYLPVSWTNDEERLAAAGVPEQVGFATKPELARQMIAAAVEHVPGAWMADEVYGRNPGLRAYLEQRGVGYVMEMAAADTLATARGPVAVKEWAVLVPDAGWQKRSAGAGAKGEPFHN